MVLARFSFAGWQLIPSGTEETLHAGTFVNANTGYLVGTRGTCLRTDDAGRSWSKVDLGVGHELTGVHFVDARRGFVCGSGGLILRSTDSGRTWQKAVTPDTGRITDITFASAAVGFAMGKYDSVLATSDSGKTWSARKIYNGSKPAVYSIRACFPTEKIGYLVSLMQLFRTEDGGLTWNPATGVPWGASYLSDCWFASPDTGFIAAVTYGSLVRTDDGGKSTRNVLPNSTNRVRFLNREIGYSISINQIRRTVDGGKGWTQDAKASDFMKSGEALRTLFVTGGTTAVVAGSNGFILRRVEESSTALLPSAPYSSPITSAITRKTKSVRLDGRAITLPAGKLGTPAVKHVSPEHKRP
jgi:photosystem II stability/assembly factor-like uncharacterized protein